MDYIPSLVLLARELIRGLDFVDIHTTRESSTSVI